MSAKFKVSPMNVQLREATRLTADGSNHHSAFAGVRNIGNVSGNVNDLKTVFTEYRINSIRIGLISQYSSANGVMVGFHDPDSDQSIPATLSSLDGALEAFGGGQLIVEPTQTKFKSIPVTNKKEWYSLEDEVGKSGVQIQVLLESHIVQAVGNGQGYYLVEWNLTVR